MGVKRFAIGVVVVMLFAGGFVTRGLMTKSTALADTSASNTKYPLLSNRLFTSTNYDPIINFVGLRQQMTTYFNQNNLSGSLFFEYLPTGTFVQINGDTQEIAASLMKLPAAMDAYKAVENGKISLDKMITLTPAMLDNGYGTLYQKGSGYQLSLGDALEIMLEQSDNTALKAVEYTTLGMVSSADGSLNAVDVDLTQNADQTISIGARSYSSFLTCLYFACYDNYQDSQTILEDLSQTPFSTRMTADIPKGVTIAHKIGVHDTDQSDCGIVYVPNKRYVLCVMLRGTDSPASDRHIAELSKMAYNYILGK